MRDDGRDRHDGYNGYEGFDGHSSHTMHFPGLQGEPAARPVGYAPGVAQMAGMTGMADTLAGATQLVGGLWDIDAEFEQLFRQPAAEPVHPGHPEYAAALQDTAEQQRVVGPARPALHRKRRPRRLRRLIKLLRIPWVSVISFCIALATGGIACVVSLLGAMVSYDPLRLLAYPTAHGLASAWPMLVYGPWLAGCLSVLRAAAHQRLMKGAWVVVTAFSAIAVVLCVAHAPRTPTAIATAGLPPVAALACFHLLYRQVTLVQPRHARVPRQRKH